LSSFFQLFANNLLPIFLIAGIGYLISNRMEINPKSISRVVFYIFSPSLVFRILTENRINEEVALNIGLYTILITIFLGLVAYLLGLLLKIDKDYRSAIVLTTMFSNVGNFGLSLNAFAFGQEALTYASVYFVVTSALIYTLGVFIASSGKSGMKAGLLNLLKIPTLYALLLAIVFNANEWSFATGIDRAVDLLADAAIPSMLILLGLQFKNIDWQVRKKELGLANILRLGIAPLAAIGLTSLLGFQGALFQANVLESSMPTAVIITVLATEYDLQPTFVTSVVTSTTLLSPLILTPLLLYLSR